MAYTNIEGFPPVNTAPCCPLSVRRTAFFRPTRSDAVHTLITETVCAALTDARVAHVAATTEPRIPDTCEAPGRHAEDSDTTFALRLWAFLLPLQGSEIRTLRLAYGWTALEITTVVDLLQRQIMYLEAEAHRLQEAGGLHGTIVGLREAQNRLRPLVKRWLALLLKEGGRS